MARWFAAIVSVATVLAGCLGGGDTAAIEQPETPARPAPTMGMIQGSVLDDEERPIANATVRVSGDPLPEAASAVTDAAGGFAFDSVPGGKYRVTAEALFYKRVTTVVDVVAGETSEVGFVLLDIVESSLFVELHQFNGYINCSVHSLGGYGPFNPCRDLADDESRFALPLREDLENKGVVLELVWTPSTQATGTDLELALCNAKDDIEDPVNCRETTGSGYRQDIRGKSPLILRAQDLPLGDYPAMEVIVGDGGQTSVRVPLTFQQSFELWMSLCYTDYCSETYSARPPE